MDRPALLAELLQVSHVSAQAAMAQETLGLLTTINPAPCLTVATGSGYISALGSVRPWMSCFLFPYLASGIYLLFVLTGSSSLPGFLPGEEAQPPRTPMVTFHTAKVAFPQDLVQSSNPNRDQKQGMATLHPHQHLLRCMGSEEEQKQREKSPNDAI